MGAAISQGTEVYADFKVWKLDAVVTTPVIGNTNIYPIPGNAIVEGNMFGLEYARTGNNQVTIQPGICMDSRNTTICSLASQQNLTLPTVINGIYNLFICNDGVVRYDTDVNGSSLAAYKIRWIGYVPNNSSGIVKLFSFKGGLVNEMWFERFTENTINTSVAVPANITTAIDISSFIPVNRVSGTLFGGLAISGSQVVAIGVVSGSAAVAFMASYAAADAVPGGVNEWEGVGGSNKYVSLITGNIYWGRGIFAASYNTQLAIHAVKLIR
jgi:hypothetical protein